MITAPERRALAYVRNTNGGATLDTFVDDHDPIGNELYYALYYHTPRLIDFDARGRVVLTSAGREMLNDS